MYVAAGLLLFVLLCVLLSALVRRTTVLEYERGLRYVRGRYHALLGPGQYWTIPLFVTLRKVDVRPRFVTVPGQEVLSADGVTLKLSLAAGFEVADPARAVNGVQNFQEALYLELQVALREIVGSVDVDTLMAGRPDLSKRLMEAVEPRARAYGLRLLSANLKDLMFPGKLRETFAQVVSARKEGLAALEKARGETAALRNLANAARLVEANPSLMQLRLVQVLGQSTGNTLVLGVPAPTVPVPVRGKGAPKGGPPPEAPPEEGP
jgi:regulator of protease activity HflC (stomatin/prohibitin superfamily)